MEQTVLFPTESLEICKAALSSPQGYKGLAAFHKYWGKKPVEYLAYLIQKLTREGEIVVDPFLGSGLIGREALLRKRRFIGVDINPISIELATTLTSPPSYDEISETIKSMEKEIKPIIDESYKLADGTIATHFLWNKSQLQSIWVKDSCGRKRKELQPAEHDLQKSSEHQDYRSKQIRDLKFFKNSRINTFPELKINDLFTGRARRNIDLLLEYIKKQPLSIRRTLLLTLTAASGQMSKMVFAVKHRGKNNGMKKDERASVGSWVIGFWRPKEHFEINVWNCFVIRARKLLKALRETPTTYNFRVSSDPLDVIDGSAEISLVNKDCRQVLSNLPDNSVSLILTDPPHSDRIPYLELSEFWNAILGFEVSFEREIVVSNARERNKNKTVYNEEMCEFFLNSIRVLSDRGIIAILFNAYDHESWEYLRVAEHKADNITFRGCFPMLYSASSVVQDNREGAMKYDYVLIYEKTQGVPQKHSRWEQLNTIEKWSTSFPKTKD